MLTRSIYKALLRAPDLPGKSRLMAPLRRSILKPDLTAVSSGVLMELDFREWVQNKLYRWGSAEPLTMALYEEVLRPGDVYFDVGAHVGFHALVARSFVGAAGLVVAVEPQPYCCARLLRNSFYNGFHNLIVHVAAAGATEGLVELHDQPVTDRSRLSLPRPGVDGANARSTAGGQSFVVPVRRLDNLMRSHAITSVRLLKVDTEGYELEVLKGLGAAIAAVDHLVLEVLPDQDARLTEEVASLLTCHGFTLRDLHGAAWTPGAPCPEDNVWATRREAPRP